MLADVTIFLLAVFMVQKGSNPLVNDFGMHVLVPDHLFLVVEVITGLIFLVTEYTWFFFSLSVNYYSKLLGPALYCNLVFEIV